MVEARTDDTGDVLAFAHQLWQEFFLARGLTESAAPLVELTALRPETVPVATALGASTGSAPVPDIVNWEEAVKLTVQLARRPEEFVTQLMQIDVALAGRSAAGCMKRLAEDVKSQLRLTLLERSRDHRVPLPERIEAAEAIGLMGDDIRYVWGGGPGTASATHRLPRRGPFLPGGHAAGWVRVPAGVYAMGRRLGDADVEQVDCGVGGEPLRVELASFEFAFAPVTNAEYALFVQDGGYENQRWWPGDHSMRWRRGELRDNAGREWQMRRHAALVADFKSAMGKFFFSPPTATNVEFAEFLRGLSLEQAQAYVDSCYPFSGKPPAFMDVADFANPLQPVVGVSVLEAQAYCRWMSAQSGVDVRLPTEAEWDAAARGLHQRAWPWGDAEPAHDGINSEALRLGRTTPVGVFPMSDTPDGLVDMAGNVWEWTLSEYTPQGLVAESVVAAAEPAALRALRGGGHHFIPDHCRPDYRFKANPLLRSKAIGFRLVCS
jgi:formylglycine-generating enzyme required for sulfatase activity